LNSPHLRPAFELDEALLQFSGNLSKIHGLNNYIHNETDLENVMRVFRETVLPGLRLWEFFVIDVATSSKLFRESVEKGVISDKTLFADKELSKLPFKEQAELLKSKALVEKGDWTRFHRTINIDIARSFIHRLSDELFYEMGSSVEAKVKLFESLVNEINLVWYLQYDDDVNAIIKNTTNRIRFMRLAPHGPRLGEISMK